MSFKWLEWAKRIQSLSQSGLAFSKDKFDIERYGELRQISAEIIAEYTDHNLTRVNNLFSQETGYQTPKVDVRGVVFKDDGILMVKEKTDNKWSLPGGFCDVGLSPSENVVKEIKGESGYNVSAKKLLALFDMNYHPHPPQPFHYYKIFIQCEIIGGHAKTGLETNDVSFFTKRKLPPLSTNRSTESQIILLFDFLDDKNKAALFD